MARNIDFETENAKLWDELPDESFTATGTAVPSYVVTEAAIVSDVLVDLEPEQVVAVTPSEVRSSTPDSRANTVRYPASHNQPQRGSLAVRGITSGQLRASVRGTARGGYRGTHGNNRGSNRGNHGSRSSSSSDTAHITTITAPQLRDIRVNPVHNASGFSTTQARPSSPRDPRTSHSPAQSRPSSSGSPRPFDNQSYRDLTRQHTGSKGGWAKNQPLVTSLQATQKAQAEAASTERQQWLDQGPDEGESSETGFYLWPHYPEPGSGPHDMFGHKLEQLDLVRTTHKVWIKWNEQTRSLRVSTKPIPNRDAIQEKAAVLRAVANIRSTYRNAKARMVRSTAIHLVHPPSAEAMASLVRPKVVTHDKPPSAFDFELAGIKLTHRERVAWEKEARPQKIQRNFSLFYKHVHKHLTAIRPLKGLMRMRIHFGHLRLKGFANDLTEGRLSLDAFEAMLQKGRTHAAIDKDVGDAMLAVKFREKILQLPGSFRAPSGYPQNPAAVIWKDTMVLFTEAEADDSKLRIEVEVDRQYEQAGIGAFEAQPSPAKAYSNKRNTIFEIRAVDIEKALDWNLEVISDNCLNKVPAAAEELLKGAITTATPYAEDSLGLQYPRVTPRLSSRGLTVRETTVRSSIRFETHFGYIVEISVYRKWQGTNTSAEPVLSVGVTMLHPQWDRDMESIEDRVAEREWNADFSNFFPGANSATGMGGLGYFLTKVQGVQQILVDVKNELTSIL